LKSWIPCCLLTAKAFTPHTHPNCCLSHILKSFFYFSIFHLLAMKSPLATTALQHQFFLPPSAGSYTTLTHTVFSTNVIFNLFCSLHYVQFFTNCRTS
jgi:hypothetical protein